jgi:predicted neuraminidase
MISLKTSREIDPLPMRLTLVSVVLIMSLFIDALLRHPPLEIARSRWLGSPPDEQTVEIGLVAEGSIPVPVGARAVHASNLLTLPKSHPAKLMAFWFAGDHESAPNVQIAASQFDRKTDTWSEAEYVVNRERMGQELGFGVRRIGNPVSWLDSQGRIHLFIVSTGLGGWAASRIAHLIQIGKANTLSELKFRSQSVLPLSWLWNVSFLVRNAPLVIEDGGMILPVYFELGVKYPSALRFDADGSFVGMTRISQHHDSLQPTLVMNSSTQWSALMRNNSSNGKIKLSRTTDSGEHWTDMEDLTLTNPDSAVATISINQKQIYLVHNSSLASRAKLDLSSSQNGQSWTHISEIRNGVAPDEFSYPAMAWVDGSLWITYTDQRRKISWKRFERVLATKGQP